jgi:hypothetical protein
MKRLIVISITVLVLFLVSCDLFDPENNDPPINMSVDNDSIPEWYPSQLTYSSENAQEYTILLDSFKTAYSISSMGLTSNPLLSNIQQLHSNLIQVCKFTASEDTLTTYCNAVDDFVSNWSRLLCMEPFEIDSVNASLDGRFYPTSHYETPVYKPIPYLGCVRFYVNTDGDLTYLTSSLVPQLPVPKNPMFNADSAKNMIIGYPWHYYAYTGGRIDCEVDSSDIASTTLEVYIDKHDDYIDYRLIWCVSTDHLPVDFLIDAMTGEFITYIKNFRT